MWRFTWAAYWKRVSATYLGGVWVICIGSLVLLTLGSLIAEGYGRILGLNPNTLIHCVRLYTPPGSDLQHQCDVGTSLWGRWGRFSPLFVFRTGAILTPALAILDAVVVATYRGTNRLVGRRA